MGNYPIQFRDEIDEYLFKEFGILAGCCASIKSFEYSVARQVAEKLWNKQKNSADSLIEKACEYISKHQCEYIDLDDFRKAMEE